MTTTADMYIELKTMKDSRVAEVGTLMEAIDRGDSDWIFLNANISKAQVNLKDEFGYTPLHSAIRQRQPNIKVIEKLLQIPGVEVDIEANNKMTPLALAVYMHITSFDFGILDPNEADAMLCDISRMLVCAGAKTSKLVYPDVTGTKELSRYELNVVHLKSRKKLVGDSRYTPTGLGAGAADEESDREYHAPSVRVG